VDEPSADAKQVLAAYRRARVIDPAVYARVRGRIAASLEVRLRTKPNRIGEVIAVCLLVAAVFVLAFLVLVAGSRTSERELGQPPSSAQRDVPPKPEHPAHMTTPPAELPASPTALERPDDTGPPIDTAAPASQGATAVRAEEPAAADTELRRELELLQAAKTERDAGDTRTSLATLAAHARAFPSGQLAQERDAIAIEIRCKTAERPRARRDLDAFARDHPSSTHLARLRSACE